MLHACAERARAFLQATAIRDGDFVNWWPGLTRSNPERKPPFLPDGQGRRTLWSGDLGMACVVWDCITGRPGFPTLDVF